MGECVRVCVRVSADIRASAGVSACAHGSVCDCMSLQQCVCALVRAHIHCGLLQLVFHRCAVCVIQEPHHGVRGADARSYNIFLIQWSASGKKYLVRSL